VWSILWGVDICLGGGGGVAGRKARGNEAEESNCHDSTSRSASRKLCNSTACTTASLCRLSIALQDSRNYSREYAGDGGPGYCRCVRIPTEAQPLVVKVALSSVSEDGAIANMDAEAPNFDFDAVHAAATATWIKELQRMDITGPPAAQENLYTAMYHALLSPNLSMDVRRQGRSASVCRC
jgi:hypothetical protein